MLLDPGIAPVVWPAVPGTQGLLTPVLSVFPVPIDALLAPVPVFPESEVVAAMLVVFDGDGVCEATDAVRLQAELAEGEVCANAAPEMARPNASEAEKIIRDILSSKNSLPRVARFTYLWRPCSQNHSEIWNKQYLIDG